MSEDIRRSGRANKGHHTKNADALDEPIAKMKAKGRGSKKGQNDEQTESLRSQSAQSNEENDDEEQEEDAIIRCVCGQQRDIQGREMICCDRCEAWQHNQCLNLPEGDYWENKQYYCELCKPEEHEELLAAMAQGKKPWNQRKGKKPPTTRAIDHKASDVQAVQVASPDPETVEPPSGQLVAKGRKKSAPKNEPQSPTAEKRRHELATAPDAANKKRRKSSMPVAPPQPHMYNDIASIPAKWRPIVEKLRDTLVPLISEASAARGYCTPDGETPTSIATRFALQIDRSALLHHGEPSGPESKYFLQFRSIMFNVKKNAILIDRLLSGSLKSEEFAVMESEEMASEEKQREYAAMREANEKQMVLTEESGPRMRKTHKGDELVDDENVMVVDDFKAPIPRDHEEDLPPAPPQMEGKGDQSVELPDDVGRAPPPPASTSESPNGGMRRASSNFDINSVFDKVRSPQHDQQAFLHRRQNSAKTSNRPGQNIGTDADIDRLLKDEDQDVAMTGYTSDPTVVWQGSLQMQQMEPFEAVARFVAGGDFGQIVPWDKLLLPALPIQGRIDKAGGDEYIRGLATTGSHDVCVLALSPISPAARTTMDNLYHYFAVRNRWGVVPVSDNEVMRDLYVIPVPPGGSSLPPFLDMLEYCTIETPRKEHSMLLALVAKLPEIKPQHVRGQIATQQHPTVPAAKGLSKGPSPSPVTNPNGPSYSPVGTSFQPAPPFGSNNVPVPHASHAAANGHQPQPPPQQHTALPAHNVGPPPLTPKTIELLGPYLHTPVISQMLLAAGGSMSDEQMANLRHIMDTVPEARHDFGRFQQVLAGNHADAGP